MIRPVKSNPKGFGIHSPFAFNLVTRVIFAGQRRSRWFAGWLGIRRDRNLEIRELLLRLLTFFRPERVLVFNSEVVVSSLFPADLPGNPTLVYVRSGEVVSTLPGDFIYLPEGEITGPEFHSGQSDKILFLADIRHAPGREYFKKLVNDGNVSQTYELNSCGIAIFNPKFQKENFVIKGKNSY
ncbi:MAG: hypothetical protein ACOZDD_05755 [Bacteroidota bacterium]